ncbi:MAG: DUF2905 domain-containing protein [bacterium]
MVSLGKIAIVVGILFVVLGLVLQFFDRIPLLGKLPGDIHVEKKNFRFYFPMTTCLVVSLILTFLFRMFRK